MRYVLWGLGSGAVGLLSLGLVWVLLELDRPGSGRHAGGRRWFSVRGSLAAVWRWVVARR